MSGSDVSIQCSSLSVSRQVTSGMSPVVPNAAPVVPAAPEPEAPAEDPFDNIFKIFNTK